MKDYNKFNKSDSIEVLNTKLKVRSNEFKTAYDVIKAYESETESKLPITMNVYYSDYSNELKFTVLREGEFHHE